MGNIVVFIFFMFVTIVYGRAAKKDFCDSLAPVVILQTLLGLLCGMVFGRVSWGIWIVFFLAVIYIAECVVKRAAAHDLSWAELRQSVCDSINDRGLLVFTLIFIFCTVWNYGKSFTAWDEFSHWGMFLKETLRLDRLYCTSPVGMAHKDYVPAVTVFEALWCRLAGGYTEANAYTAIQMLQYAFLMPVILHTDHEGKKIYDGTVKWKSLISDALKMGMLLFLLVYTSEFFYIFHTIYQDSVVAVMLAYAMYTAGQKKDTQRIWKLTCVLAFMALAKMTAILFLPTVIVYLMVNLRLEKRKWSNMWVNCAVTLLLPICLWGIVQAYIKHYVPAGNEQSLGGFGIRQILAVILHDGSIPYQNYVEYRFFGNQLIRPVFGFLTPALIMVILIAYLGIRWIKAKEQDAKQHFFWLGMWTALTYFYYLAAQWMLYLLAFSEYEATNLASFQRYMLTFLFAPIVLVYREILLERVDRDLNKADVPKRAKLFRQNFNFRWAVILMLLAVYTCIVHRAYLIHMMPGIFSDDSEMNAQYKAYAGVITDHVSEDTEESVLMIICGDDGRTWIRVNYYASPRNISYVSPGGPRYENDFRSIDYDAKSFADYINLYDWLYFIKLDNQFEEKYKKILNNPERNPSPVRRMEITNPFYWKSRFR